MKRVSRFLLRRAWPGAVAALLGIALLVLALTIGPKKLNPPGSDVPGEAVTGWGLWAVLVGVPLAVLGIMQFVQVRERARWRRPDIRNALIGDLSRSIQTALSAINLIREEVEEGNQLLEKLEQETEIKSKIAKLSAEDAKAVVAQMQEVARQATGRGTRVQVVVNFVFFVAGALVSFLVTRL